MKVVAALGDKLATCQYRENNGESHAMNSPNKMSKFNRFKQFE